MLSSLHDILSEIDETIEQLIRNDKVLKKIESKDSYEQETKALERTQESLLAHLMHMDDLLKKNPTKATLGKDPLLFEKVHQKLGRAGYLNQLIERKKNLKRNTSTRSQSKPKIHKRKTFARKPI